MELTLKFLFVKEYIPSEMKNIFKISISLVLGLYLMIFIGCGPKNTDEFDNIEENGSLSEKSKDAIRG